MQPFEYASPKTLKEALGLLGGQWADAGVLAGGTDLLNLLKDSLYAPRRVVNIKGIAALGGISKTAAGLRIGATATVDDLLASAAVRTEYPSLAQAARGIASPQIRNMGTIGGDLCQRPRCWYYRTGFGLLATKDGRSLVEAGDNRYHAIFHDGPAKFVSASSFGPALIALGAKLKLVSASGEREVEAAKFFVAPQNEAAREIALLPNEILAEIVVPPAVGVRNATYEVRQKEALDWPLATASVALRMKGTAVASAAIVLGHVGPTPHLAAGAGSALEGKPVNAQNAEAAAAAAVAGARPLSGNAYKVTLAKTAVKRALLLAATGKALA
jgi:xanthine dehydrogenase YagS FAD-binding subunit